LIVGGYQNKDIEKISYDIFQRTNINVIRSSENRKEKIKFKKKHK